MKASEPATRLTLSSPEERMEAVWIERAARLSQPLVSTGAGEKAIQVIVVGIGRERYGVDLADVAEVLPPVRVTPVPGAPAIFAGVISVHGEIRPVVDLRRLLGLETLQHTEPWGVILLRHKGSEMGLEIEAVDQIRWIGFADWQSGSADRQSRSGDMQSGGDGLAGSSHYIKRSTKDLLMLLSMEALFAELKNGVDA